MNESTGLFLRHSLDLHYLCAPPGAREALSVLYFLAVTRFLLLSCHINLAFLSVHSVCHYSRLFWEWGDGVKVHDSQKRQDPEKLSKENVLSFIQAHYP